MSKIQHELNFHRDRLIKQMRELSQFLEREALKIEKGETPNSCGIIQGQASGIDARAGQVVGLMKAVEILDKS